MVQQLIENFYDAGLLTDIVDIYTLYTKKDILINMEKLYSIILNGSASSFLLEKSTANTSGIISPDFLTLTVSPTLIQLKKLVLF